MTKRNLKQWSPGHGVITRPRDGPAHCLTDRVTHEERMCIYTKQADIFLCFLLRGSSQGRGYNVLKNTYPLTYRNVVIKSFRRMSIYTFPALPYEGVSTQPTITEDCIYYQYYLSYIWRRVDTIIRTNTDQRSSKTIRLAIQRKFIIKQVRQHSFYKHKTVHYQQARTQVYIYIWLQKHYKT